LATRLFTGRWSLIVNEAGVAVLELFCQPFDELPGVGERLLDTGEKVTLGNIAPSDLLQ
jgi:hypothetical protein